MLSSGDTVRHSSCSRGLTVQREQQAPCKPVTVIWRHDVTLRVGTVWLRVQSYSVWFGECPAGHHIGASIKEDSRWVSGHLPGVLGRKNSTNKSIAMYFLFSNSEAFLDKILDIENIF